jgi:SAM-dependent methyltransferase
LYEKLGYSRFGDQFEEVTIPHWKMEKSLAFSLNQIVPWGRNFNEYVRMFSLTDADLEKKILACGDGPASFNAAMRRTGKRVVSVDPLYQFSSAQIRGRVQEACQTIVEKLVANQSTYVWTTIASPQDLGRIRMAAMEDFLLDFEQGKEEGRYLPCELPQLPFADGQFDLALCSHLLFTYSGQLSCEFHGQAILEMCRVAKELRVFPLLDHGGQPSPHVEIVCDQLDHQGYSLAIETVGYEFQRGANKMLRVWR